MMFCKDTIKLLIDAKDISKRNGFGYIPEIILFGTLALQDGPLHTYLANKGLDNIKIARKVKKMYDKYFEEEKERLELFERNKEMITENPTDYQLEEKDIEDCGLEEDKYTFTRMNLIISNRDQESIQVITTTEILNITASSQLSYTNSFCGVIMIFFAAFAVETSSLQTSLPSIYPTILRVPFSNGTNQSAISYLSTFFLPSDLPFKKSSASLQLVCVITRTSSPFSKFQWGRM